MRLVPDQHPDKIANLFEAYLNKIAPKTVELKLTRMHGGKPWMTEFDNKYVRAAGKAIELGLGKTPEFNREGGAIPVVSTFQESSACRACCSASVCPTRTRTLPTGSWTSATSTTGIIASAFLYNEIANT
jgi:hypothetical protein